MDVPGIVGGEAGGRGEAAAPAAGSGLGVLGLALAGAGLAAGAVYLCRYVFVHDLPPGSVAVLSAALGLIAAFCILTVAVIGGIRQLIIEPEKRFLPALALTIALSALAAAGGLLIVGLGS